LSKNQANISVVIPAYNRANLIGETLRSLLNQTVPAKEIIVVDDGSTDGTAEAVEREFSVFREQFSGNSKSNIQNPTFKILRQANAGPGAARNLGLAEATGDFIHFFDSDDIAAPNKHEVQLRALLETGADIAYGPWVKGRFAPVEKLQDFLTTDDTDKHGYQKNQHGNAQGTCARAASGPAEALFADHGEIGSAGGNQLADSKEFLEDQSQAGLQMDNQKNPTIRTANDPSASGEYSSSV
jgi:glycosyltransferase involved in cell wall biosynthesis